MFYFDFKISDYRADTRRLSAVEHGVYNLMLHEYYYTETPLPIDQEELFRVLGVRGKPEELAVIKIISKFWLKTDAGYIQKRAYAEIQNYQTLCAKKKEGGRLGGLSKHKRSIENAIAQSSSTTLAPAKQVLDESTLENLAQAKEVLEKEGQNGYQKPSSLVIQYPVTSNQDTVPSTQTSQQAGDVGGRVALADALAYAEKYSRGNPMGLVIDDAWVSEWFDSRETVGWVTVRSGTEIPIQNWQADLRSFAQMKHRYSGSNAGTPTKKERGGFSGASKNVEKVSVNVRPPSVHPDLVAPPCDWRGVMEGLYPVEEYPDSDRTSPWGMYPVSVRTEVLVRAKELELLSSDWKQPVLGKKEEGGAEA